MNTQRGSRSTFFLTTALSEWGNLQEYIIHSQAGNRDNRTYPPEKFAQLYKTALEEIIKDETRTADERSMAEALKATNLASNMKDAWEAIKTTPPQESASRLKRRIETAPKISEPWMSMMMHVARK
ncbi:hypothetical protein BGX34_006691, partial [Mortierella sp. NVP85]